MKRTSPIISRILLFAFCFLLAFVFSGSIPKEGVINDEAIELLVAQDLPTDQVYYFAPNYQGGSVVLIEALVPYANLLISRVFGYDLRFIHLFFALCYGLACYVFFLLVKDVYRSEKFAVFGTILLAGASYACFYNRILTRNGISILWTSLLMWVVWKILHASTEHRKSSLYLLCLPLVLILALWTYTSFKFINAAVYVSLGMWCLSYSPLRKAAKKKEWGYLFSSVAITFLLFLALLVISKTSLHYVIFRGSYVLGGSLGAALKKYLSHLVYSLLLPVYFKPGGDFLIEVTHTAYNRHTLPIFLVPFFLLGVWETLRLWKKSFGFQQVTLLIWFFGTALLAVGGPNLKHHFALFPCVLWIALYGLKQVADWVSSVFHDRTVTLLAIAFIAVYFGGELHHLYNNVPQDGLLILDAGLPKAVSQVTLRQVETGTDVYLVEGWGRDAVRLYTRKNPNIHYIPNVETVPQEIQTKMLSHQSLSIVREGKDVPEFFKAHPNLNRCFEKNVQHVGRWDVSVYLLRGDCSL